MSKKPLRKARHPLGNHAPRVIAAGLAANLPPGLHVAHVYHDEWCRFFDNRPCNCELDVRIETVARGPGAPDGEEL